MKERRKTEQPNPWWKYTKGWRSGGGCGVALRSQMTILAWNCWGLGSSLPVRTLTDEVKMRDPLMVFLAETKTGESRIKGVWNKIGYTQGITVSSDRRSEGLALMWKEGTKICFKSCSNSHIDVVVNGEWRATGFTGNLMLENVSSLGNCWKFWVYLGYHGTQRREKRRSSIDVEGRYGNFFQKLLQFTHWCGLHGKLLAFTGNLMPENVSSLGNCWKFWKSNAQCCG